MREVSAMPHVEAQVRAPSEEPASGVVPAGAPAPVSGFSTESAAAPAPLSREQRRSRRARAVRARTVSVKRMTKRELELGRLLYPPEENEDVKRPRTRADCEGSARPCPFVSCVHHLYLDVSAQTGAIKLNFPDLEVWELAQSCALDVAARGGTTLEDVGAIMNLTRERIRQVEVRAVAKLQAVSDLSSLREHYGESVDVGRRNPRRHLPLLPAGEGEEEHEDAEDAKTRDDIDPDEFAGPELDDDGS